MTYSAQEVVANLNASLWPLLLTGALSFIGYFVYYGEAIRLGAKQKTFSVPVVGNMYFFAHDIVFLFLFDYWFNEVDHWLFQVFWFGILAFTILELVVHFQTIRYGLQEVFPNLPRTQALMTYVAMQLAIGVLFWFAFYLIEDPLYFIHFSMTVALSTVLMHPMVKRRGSAKGQSTVLAMSLILTPAIFYFGFLQLAAEFFQSLPYLLMGLVTVGMAVLYFFNLRKHLKKEEQELHASEVADLVS